MKLVPIESNIHAAIPILYEILSQRPLEHGISHRAMPSYDEHIKFVMTNPFRYWYLIEEGEAIIGAIECLPTNEFGIHLLQEFQNRGYGTKAVQLFLGTHSLMPAIPAARNEHWLANVAVKNEGAKAFFTKLGFHKIQETYEL